MVSLLRVKLRRDVRRQAAQFAAVTITLLVGVALFVATSDAYNNLDASYKQLYKQLRFADVTVTGGPVQEVAQRAEAAGAVTAVRTVADVPLAVGDATFLGRVVGMPVGSQPAVDQVQMLSGSYLEPGDPRGALVEQHMASHFGLAAGDTVRISGQGGWIDAVVRGVVASPEYLWPARSRQEIFAAPGDFGVLFVPETLATSVAPPDTPQQVAVYGADPALVAELGRIATDGEALSVITREEQPSNAALQEDVSGFGELAVLFPILFLSAGAMAAFVLLGRLVRTQRAQIGTLTANGFSSRTIFRAYLRYGVLVGLAGGILGAIAGVALGTWITHLYTAAISVPITVIRITWTTPVIGIAIALAAAIVATVAPARAAAHVPPAEAMHGIAPVGTARPSIFERLVPAIRRLPSRWKLAIRDIGRSRRRTASTMIGVVLSLVLILVSWGMLDTTQILLAQQFDTVQRQDAQLFFTPNASPSAVVTAATGIAGVDTVEAAAQLDVSIAHGGGSYSTSLLALPPDTTMHTFLAPGGASEALPTEGLLVGSALQGQLQVAAGDVVTVAGPGLPRPVQLPIAGFVDEPLGTLAYTSLPALELAAGATDLSNTALVRFAPGVDRARLLSELAAVPGVATVLDAQGLQSSVDSLMQLFYVFVGIMLLFGGLMSFGLMFNTMSANVAERAGEMATLRAAGVGRRTISGILTRENVLVTAIAVPLGLVIGYLLAASFMSSFNSDLFRFTLHVRWTTLVLSALAMFVVALLSQWPGIRTVGRLDVARVVRERSV
jgi:putative ABC transport system permease protein